MEVLIQEEPISDMLKKEMAPLFEVHYDQVGKKDLFEKVDPDWGYYDAVEKLGFLRINTLRIDGRLVGYWIFLVRKNPHYRTTTVASDDILFVHPAHRGHHAQLFMGRVIEKMKAQANVISVHCKTYFDLEKIYVKLGFEPFEKSFIQKGTL